MSDLQYKSSGIIWVGSSDLEVRLKRIFSVCFIEAPKEILLTTFLLYVYLQNVSYTVLAFNQRICEYLVPGWVGLYLFHRIT